MSDPVTLDLRQDSELVIAIDEGVSYVVNFGGFINLDSNYTFTINESTYNVSNGGIIIVQNPKSVIINIGASDFPKGTYKGRLVSDSKIFGIHINLPIIIKSYGIDSDS